MLKRLQFLCLSFKKNRFIPNMFVDFSEMRLGEIVSRHLGYDKVQNFVDVLQHEEPMDFVVIFEN